MKKARFLWLVLLFFSFTLTSCFKEPKPNQPNNLEEQEEQEEQEEEEEEKQNGNTGWLPSI